MRHRHHHISRETPTLCTTQSRGFVFILRSFAPSALDVASKVEQHRKATAALLLPSAALEPKVERMWSVQAAVQIAQRREVGRSSPSRSLSAQFSLSNSSLAVTRGGGVDLAGHRARLHEGRFLRRVGRFFPKAAWFGSKSPGFSPEGAALLPTSPSFLGTARGGVQKNPPLSA